MMMKNFTYIQWGLTALIAGVFLIIACNKDETITGIIAQERYINNTGHDMTITRYMTGTGEKSFAIANDDTLYIESSLDAGADSTGSIFRADSAKVIFDDAKTYSMKDTTNSGLNFLKAKRTISPSGKTHYYRYTFAASDYTLAE
ncbi:MAG: hypothetical protein ACK5NK_01050 [Niabella sp.]